MASAIAYRRKLALVIGINTYHRDSLNFCINDATDLKTTLQRINFNVSLGQNCNLSEFYRIVDTFVETIERDDLVLFYFAGHGKQKDEGNYLLPSDYNYDYRGHEHDYIVNHAVNVQYIMNKIDDKMCRITIYLFDCCRNLVRTRATNTEQGLSPMHASLKTLIVFACAPRKSILDETRNNRNGSFIENLLKHIETPDKDIEEIMKDVARDVELQTAGFQLPYRTSSLTSKIFLVTNSDQDQNLRDQQYDRDYTNTDDRGRRFTRGGVEYHRPCGWKRYAIKVVGKYEDEVWLGSNDSSNEWPVSYHATGYNTINSIVQNGYNSTRHSRFMYGPGIYSTPDINVAKGYAKSFTVNAQEYLAVLQNRVNPKNLIKLSREKTGVGEYWISPTAADFRPYGICIMKKS